MSNLTYKPADSSEGEFLTEQAIRSKQYWGYSDELMSLWKGDLTVSESYIESNEVIKVFDGDTYVGFYALKPSDQHDCYELDHFWLDTSNVQKGYGNQIFRKVKQDLIKKDQSKLILIAEPNAIGFYNKMGGVPIDKFESKVSGRFLDIYQFNF